MPSTLLSTSELAELIQPDALEKAGFPRPKRVSIVAGTDHTGEEALYATIVYPDDTPLDRLTWARVKPMVQWIRDQVRAADDEQRWAFVNVTREADLVGNLA